MFRRWGNCINQLGTAPESKRLVASGKPSIPKHHDGEEVLFFAYEKRLMEDSGPHNCIGKQVKRASMSIEPG
jgi:hypothetical protein